MRTTALLLLLIAVSVFAGAAMPLRFDATVKGNCTGKPIVVSVKDLYTAQPLRAQVTLQVSVRGVWEERYFNWTDSSTGTLTFTMDRAENYTIVIDRPGYVPYQTTMLLQNCPECRFDYDCNATQYCLDSKCLNVTGTCGYAHNHRWVPFECCSNDACAGNASCMVHMCITLTGLCGRAVNHTWYAYDCCGDAACGTGKQCVDHACIATHECEADTDCALEQACDAPTHKCIALTGNCGYASNHTWVNYACCMDSSCTSSYCFDNHTCSPRPRGAGTTPTPGTGGGDLCAGSTGMLALGAIAIVLLVAVGGFAFLVGRRSHGKPDEKAGKKQPPG